LTRPDFDEVWERILRCAGEIFIQKRGGQFSFDIRGETLELSRTNQNLSRAVFEKAYESVPLDMPSRLNHLRAPSYLFAILMDPRVRREDW
jgi:hypothetical protein